MSGYTGMRLSKKKRPTRHVNKKHSLALPKTPMFINVDVVLVWDKYMGFRVSQSLRGVFKGLLWKL